MVELESRIRKNVRLAPLTSFGIGGCAHSLLEAQSEDDIRGAFRWAAAAGLPVAVLGGGSNVVVHDHGFAGLVLQVAVRGLQQEGCRFQVGAGESWDVLVDRTVEAGCAGMECLAGIPGSVGATPVQNVGAYGQEVAQTITSVRAYDREVDRFVELSAAECHFRYRQSLFNTEQRGRYVITEVRFTLRSGEPPELRYAELRRHFEEALAAGQGPTLAEVAAAVRAIRRSKGMVLTQGDPDTQSAGSYFKNPVVPAEAVQRIADAAGVEAEAMPVYPAGEGYAKLSAAWLVERAGFRKGFRLGAAGVSTKHSLALTNRGGALYADLLALEEHIRTGVWQQFGVHLEREPVTLG